MTTENAADRVVSWGLVADQVLAHPHRSGGSTITFGIACAAIGVLHRDANMISLGAGAASLGGCQFMGFVHDSRLARFES